MTHFFVSRHVRVMSRQIDLSTTAAAVVALKGSWLSSKTAPCPSYFKGCAQEHTNNAFFNEVNRNEDKQNITALRAGL